MNELDFIALLRPSADSIVARGLADDAAIFGDMVLTHDIMIAGTHFLPNADPADVAWKLLAVNLSDLAAKGARPLGILLGYTLGDDDWDCAFAAGLADALSHYETGLWGGDTVALPPHATDAARAIGLTAIGRATHLPVPSRAAAQPGDSIWVTGTLGLAYAGYCHDARGAPASEAAMNRFRRPAPRIMEGIALAPLVTAIMDISDGLLLDATRLADASAVTLSLNDTSIPVAAELAPTDHRRALSWGDDYELLFTLPPGVSPPVAATLIGNALARGPHALLIDNEPPARDHPLGWQHRSA